MARNIHLPRDRYLAALHRIREQIANGSKLETEDSNYSGDKNLSCTWGLCSDRKEQWPDEQDYLFNREPLAILYREEDQVCPFDSNQNTNDRPLRGCYYRCRIFQHPTNPPTRQEALELYAISLDRHSTGV